MDPVDVHAVTAALSELPSPSTLFASDNASGVHPAVMDALLAANQGHALAYGADVWTDRAVAAIRSQFDAPVDVSFTWGGTGANVVALSCALQPWQAVICADSAHIAVDECGAPERFTGSKLIGVPARNGKLSVQQVLDQLRGLRDQHHVQPHVVSITQTTETGTRYSVDEVAALCDTAHANDMVVHVDGARIANAVAGDGSSLRTMLVDTGVDLVSFGGTKNGMMYGEAVVFLTPALGESARFVRKQAAQLPSKMRFVAAQFEALLSDELWLRNAAHANRMASLLATTVESLPDVQIEVPVESNAVFVSLPSEVIAPLAQWSPFWVWDETSNVVRWMCSYDTTPDDVQAFAAGVAAAVDVVRIHGAAEP